MTSATEHYKQAEEHSARAASWLEDGFRVLAAARAELARLELDLAKTAALVLGEPCPDPWSGLSAEEKNFILRFLAGAREDSPSVEERIDLHGLLERLGGET